MTWIITTIITAIMGIGTISWVCATKWPEEIVLKEAMWLGIGLLLCVIAVFFLGISIGYYIPR